jgi:hypothetical protein
MTMWPALDYESWRATCDTLHAHTQVLGKLAATLAPPEPQLQHAALRLTARGYETLPLPAPDGSGAFVASLDLHAHVSVVEHVDGRSERVALTPDRPVGDVTRAVLAAVRGLAGHAEIDPTPQEVSWTVPLDEDTEHAIYDPDQVATYLAAATRAALVLGAFRAPYRGRATPVNAWWGSFDLAVNLFSGRPAEPPSDDFITRNAMDSQEVAIGWWPGDAKYGKAAFYAYTHPAPEGSGTRRSPRRRRAGTAGWACTCSTTTMCAPAPTHTRPRSSSRARPGTTPAARATGIPGSPAARRAGRHRSSSVATQLAGARSRRAGGRGLAHTSAPPPPAISSPAADAWRPGWGS